jgi:acetolactate synthase-1/2/3 large subunit
MPDNAIVSDEAATCGLAMFPVTVNAPPHDWMTLTGGAIGQGLPLSLGAAIACPDRKVIASQADGSAMYTVQALWSMARENTDVTVVIFNNRSYAILNIELARVGAGQPTPKTLSMLDLSRPDINWVEISEGMGVPATRATTAGEFDGCSANALSILVMKWLEYSRLLLERQFNHMRPFAGTDKRNPRDKNIGARHVVSIS